MVGACSLSAMSHKQAEKLALIFKINEFRQCRYVLHLHSSGGFAWFADKMFERIIVRGSSLLDYRSKSYKILGTNPMKELTCRTPWHWGAQKHQKQRPRADSWAQTRVPLQTPPKRRPETLNTF